MDKLRPLTQNQSAVQNALAGSSKPMTAYEILNLPEIRKAGMKAPLTIYRALDKLIEHGMVHRIESLNAFIACDHGPHQHASGFLICNACGRTREVPLKTCETHLSARARDAGYHVDSLRVEMSGICPDCNV